MPNSESMHAYSKACLFLKITAMVFVNGKGFSVSAAACSPVLRVFCGSRCVKKESVKQIAPEITVAANKPCNPKLSYMRT